MKYFTIWLSLICIVMFILQISAGITDSLLLNQDSWFQPWRFVTSIFLHGSSSHLIFNLFALILFGLITEKVIGSNRFLVVFFISGIFANLVAVNFYSESLGASGAIYGILGCLTILRPRMVIWAFNLPMPLFVAAILWILMSVVGIFVPSNIGDIAHLSGIVAGFIFGFLFRNSVRVVREKKQKIDIPESYARRWENNWMR